MPEQNLTGKLMDIPEEKMPNLDNLTKKVVFGPGKYWPDYVIQIAAMEKQM